jgi:uncharacterized protein YoxC
LLYNILAVVVTIAILVLIIYLIPMINQLKKTARSAERFFDVTEEDLKPLLKELKETASQANRISSGAREGIDKIVSFLEAVEDIGKTIKSVNSAIRGGSSSFLITLAALGVGVRRGLEVFFKGLLKGGDNNGRK